MFSETATGLEQMFQNLASESNKIGLEMNTSKTKIMTNSIETPISIEGQNIEYVKEYIYLGKLTSFHSNRNENEVDRRVNLAWRKYWAQKEILKGDYSLKMKKIIMDSCILPTLTYSSTKIKDGLHKQLIGLVPLEKDIGGRQKKRWADDIVKIAGKNWTTTAQNRHNWKKMEEAFTRTGAIQ
ncbi:Putative uncharacterized transposon-derived protein F52C9.6 [Eumeta japonica]|uniref:Uncharacterized transposon-derived protein F52C9.6 n=1 Tax=Eumeta variegata TaxID=151549 RepID=A0A4C1U5H8_EUMVA|nr:Putative uncharacterized transposon-derived protein F52C9.6 [Eumeta japonica]